MISHNIDPSAMAETMVFAAKAHDERPIKPKNRFRKGGSDIPYIVHPYRVFCFLMYRLGIYDMATLQASLLHDVDEDTEVTLEEIAAEFGDEVASLVQELTNNKDLPRDERKAEMIVKAATMSDKAKIIKIADRYDNLSGAKNDFSRESYLHYITESCKLCESLKQGIDPNTSPGYLVLGIKILDDLVKEHQRSAALSDLIK